jgi:hypothetical protein
VKLATITIRLNSGIGLQNKSIYLKVMQKVTIGGIMPYLDEIMLNKFGM